MWFMNGDNMELKLDENGVLLRKDQASAPDLEVGD